MPTGHEKMLEDVIVMASDDVNEGTTVAKVGEDCKKVSRSDVDVYIASTSSDCVVVDRRSYPNRVYSKLSTAKRHLATSRPLE